MYELDEILSSPAFYLLGGGAVIATLIGYIWGRRMGWVPLPWWQLIVIILAELGAGALFAGYAEGN